MRWSPRACLLPLALLAAGACGSAEAGSSPVTTVRQFLEAMDRSATDASALEEAHGLLDATARAALAARADRANSLSGRNYEPWRMLAQGRFRLRFAPARAGGLKERIDGERAVVWVRGDREGQKAEIPLVREDGGWRIQLAIPPMHGDTP